MGNIHASRDALPTPGGGEGVDARDLSCGIPRRRRWSWSVALASARRLAVPMSENRYRPAVGGTVAFAASDGAIRHCEPSGTPGVRMTPQALRCVTQAACSAVSAAQTTTQVRVRARSAAARKLSFLRFPGRGGILDGEGLGVTELWRNPGSTGPAQGVKNVHHAITQPVRNRALDSLIGSRTGLADVSADVQRLLGVPVNVLIQGESGTGKELVARALHADDPARSHRSFVPINCAALPEQLLEADLFGYRRGSFTGADRDRQGAFQVADGGTLFLDEVGELPLSLQPKLLRVLQERAVRPLGGRSETSVDLRVVAATNRDLVSAMAEGTFRTDLYYRLADYVITVPPLRERRQDIPRLSHHFFECYREEFYRPHIRELSDEALVWLQSRDWCANNVRELSVALKRAVLRCDGPVIGLQHMSLELRPTAGTLRQRLDRCERAEVEAALERTQGNLAAAARLLGVKRSTLFDRLRKLGIHRN